jgi:hypothetical protein
MYMTYRLLAANLYYATLTLSNRSG